MGCNNSVDQFSPQPNIPETHKFVGQNPQQPLPQSLLAPQDLTHHEIIQKQAATPPFQKVQQDALSGSLHSQKQKSPSLNQNLNTQKNNPSPNQSPSLNQNLNTQKNNPSPNQSPSLNQNLNTQKNNPSPNQSPSLNQNLNTQKNNPSPNQSPSLNQNLNTQKNNPSPNQSPPFKILSKQNIIRNDSVLDKEFRQMILDKFIIAKQVIEMLDGVNHLCFTHNQAKDLSKLLINAIHIFQQPSNIQEIEAVKELFDQENINLIKKQKLFYFKLLDNFLSKIKEKNLHNISQNSKSRIYHTIANIKKEINGNDYKELTESELQEIVKYESIADKTQEIGEKIGFKLQSIKKQSQKMVNLIVKCMKDHAQAVSQMKFDLSEGQILKMAQISRQACNYSDNGVFVILVYFVESCRRLQMQQRKPNQIEKLLKESISLIYSQYPPGTGLSQEHQGLIKTLKQLQDPKNYNKVEFKHQETALTSHNKQQQVDKLITKYAQIAEQCKQPFEELVKATCLSKCVYFKIGLKYYPKNPNLKALTRIKEKMFFKKDSNEQKKTAQSSVKQVLEKEQSLYRKQIDEILQKTDRVQFKISDMVRGKCVFLDVADIIYSVNEIKKFVAQNPQFGIAQIQSRFTNKLPISDVTLKIVINNKIVAELQLTIQTNAAAYAFAHKIYELQRTKVFSKLKIVHNYFQEFRYQFLELAADALQMQSTKSILSLDIIKNISQYFQIQQKSETFRGILEEEIEEDQRQRVKLQISVDPLLQDLISIVFNQAIGKWGKELGQIINKALKKEQISPKLKSVVLSTFLTKFYLPTQSQNMQQIFILQGQKQKKIYMQEYLRQFFQIEQAFKYAYENQRLFHRASQLKQVIVYKKYQSWPIQVQSKFIRNMVIEQHNFYRVRQLQELCNFYFVTRKEDNKLYSMFLNYYQMLKFQIEATKDIRIQQLNQQLEIVVAQYLIEENQETAAQSTLLNSIKYFKEKQDHQKVMQCQILFAQCKVRTEELSLTQKDSYYQKNVLEKAKIMGLELRGSFYADSLWRIQNVLWDKCKDQNEKKIILQTFTKRALEEMSRSKGRQFIYAIIKKWAEYEKNEIQKPRIKQNNKITYAKLKDFGDKECERLSKADWKNIAKLELGYSIGVEGCQYLSKGNWKNITSLTLSSNKIGDAGCEQLSKADWKNIDKLELGGSNIGAKGCEHLSKADWKNITTLELWQNNIEAKGCENLAKANWKNLTTIDLRSTYIGVLGCQHLSKADWKNLTSLNLQSNDIGDAGCQYISKADWKNITSLNLTSNKIGVAGCEYISKANWKNIMTLNLWINRIGDEGCEHLSKGDWKNISKLDIGGNKIGDLGCEYISKADWKNMTTLLLGGNSISAKGCEHLSKADWKNMTKIELWENSIGDAGCEYLSKADWKNMASLSLGKNGVGVVGCEHLSRADWMKLSYLSLSNNNLEMQMYNSLKKLFPQKSLLLSIQ